MGKHTRLSAVHEENEQESSSKQNQQEHQLNSQSQESRDDPRSRQQKSAYGSLLFKGRRRLNIAGVK